MPIMRDYKNGRRGLLKEEPSPPRSLNEALALRKRVATMVMLSLAVAISGIALFFVRGGFLERAGGWRIVPDTGYSEQIDALDNVQSTLSKLDEVLTDQKKTLEERQRALEQLRREHAALRQILAIDQASIEAIFEQQRLRAEREIWKERGVAFLLGILSGLLTALILHWIRLWRT